MKQGAEVWTPSQLVNRAAAQGAALWRKISGDFPKGMALTLLYLCLILLLRGGDAWELVWKGELNKLGDFLAGVFTPVAFGWLIYGYLLQYREFGLQREELQATRKTLGTQVAVLQEQVADEHRQSEPYLFLQAESGGGEKRNFVLRNFGRPVRDLHLALEDDSDERGSTEQLPVLATDQGYQLSIPALSSSRTSKQKPVYYYRVSCRSERQEEWDLRWRITFTGQTSSVGIQLVTKQRL